MAYQAPAPPVRDSDSHQDSTDTLDPALGTTVVDPPTSLPVEVTKDLAERTESQELWDDAVERFRSDSGKDDLPEVVEHASLEVCLDSVQQTMDSLELQHSTKKELRNRIRVTLTMITTFSDSVGAGVGLVSLPFLTSAAAARYLRILRSTSGLSTSEDDLHRCQYIGDGT